MEKIEEKGWAVEIFPVDELHCFRTRNILDASFKFVKNIRKLKFLFRLNSVFI